MPATALAAGGFPFLGVLRAGSAPEAIAVDSGTHMVYIAYEGSGTVVGFDPIKGQVRWSAALGSVVTDVQADSTTHRVYAASFSYDNRESLFAIFDGITGKTLLLTRLDAPLSDFADNNIAIDPDHQRVFITNNQAGRIDLFRAQSQGATNPIPTAFLTTGLHTQSVGVNGRLGRLYVTDASALTMAVYDENSGKKLASIPICNDPVPPVRVDETNGRVYVVCSAGQELDVINGKNNTVLARVPVSPYPEGVAFNTATGRIYVADEGNRDNGNSDVDTGTTITVIDGQSFNVLGTLQVGQGPDGVESDPALRRVYVACEDSNAVVEISDVSDIPLQGAPNLRADATIARAVSLLQKATIATIALMLATLVLATLGALLQRSRAQESPQIPPGGASSR
ncbi:MAG TPA: YncE family protein [Ktedonobacteraceae bacterium]|nr:YncE family protein [Ktedonobacteraceae bacterium]